MGGGCLMAGIDINDTLASGSYTRWLVSWLVIQSVCLFFMYIKRRRKKRNINFPCQYIDRKSLLNFHGTTSKFVPYPPKLNNF